MKLNTVTKTRDVESSSEDTIEYGIDTSNMGLLYSILSQYSNPIGSMVRELTTNAFDSHLEAGVHKPVHVRISKDNPLTGSYQTFEVEDYGVGLSPDRVRNIYSKFLASTKRDDNIQHGAFGLGSKSPFSYSDLFYMVTRFDGTEYTYALHKGSKAPSIDLLTEEETQEPNGTRIVVNIDSGDRYKFEKAIKSQLAYFDNIVYKGLDIDNDYRIFEGDSFLYRQNANSLGINKLHICLGKVYYPLDMKTVEIERIVGKNDYRYDKSVDTPIALKFEIGELPIIWSRENIEYTDEAITKIKERYAEAQEELLNLYKSNMESVDSITEFYAQKNLSKEKSVRIADGIEVESAGDMINFELNYAPCPNLKSYPTIDKVMRLIYKPHKHHRNNRAEKDNIGKVYKYNLSTRKIVQDGEAPYYFSNTVYKTTQSHSTLKNKYISEVLSRPTFYIIKKREGKEKAEEQEILRTFGYEEMSFEKVAPEVVKEIKRYTLDSLKMFEKMLSDYDAVEVTPEFKAAKRGTNTKKGMFDPSSDEFDPDLKIHLKRLSAEILGYNRRRVETNFHVTEPKIKNILDTASSLRIYGFQDDTDMLEEVGKLMKFWRQNRISSYSANRHLDSKFEILKVAKNKISILNELSENLIHVNDFISSNNKYLREIATALHIAKLDDEAGRYIKKFDQADINLLKELGMEEFHVSLSKALKDLQSAYSSSFPFIETGFTEKNIGHKLYHLLKDEDLVNKDVVENYNLATEYLNKYPLLASLMTSDYNISSDVLKEELQSYLKGKDRVHPMLKKRLEKYKASKFLKSNKCTNYEDEQTPVYKIRRQKDLSEVSGCY